jgi:class 3 adenylate cyclase
MNLKFLKIVALLVILFGFAFAHPVPGQAQSIEQTEDSLKELFGLERLEALNELTLHYHNQYSRKALRYGRQAVALGENIFVESNTTIDFNEQVHLVRAYYQLGKAQYDRGNYFESEKNLDNAESLATQINNLTYLDDTRRYLQQIDSLIESGEIKENFFSKTFGDLKVGQAISETSQDVAITTEIMLGQNKENKNEFLEAIEHYGKAMNMLKNTGDAERLNELQIKIAFLLDSLEQHEEAQRFLGDAIIEMEAGLDSTLLAVEIDQLPGLIEPETPRRIIPQESLQIEQKNLKDLADIYAREKDYEKSLSYYKLYEDLSQKMKADSMEAATENERKVREIMLLRQQKQIADLNVEAAELEKEKQIRLRNTLILISLLILIATLVTLYFYITKKKEHKKLEITFRDLDKTKGKLVTAEQRIVKLLRQQVSGDVAKELLMNTTDKPGERRFVAIMFLDIRDFTRMAENLTPEELITYQNNVFGFMIDIVQQHNGNINQLLGDGFMATFGAPVSHGNDCQNAFFAAKEILKEVRERSDAGLISKTKVGIGLHAGHVVTGNVGNEARKQYSVTGNPVIIASRVEQLNKEYKSQLLITEEIYNKLDKPLQLNQPFLEVTVKGTSHPVKILKIA